MPQLGQEKVTDQVLSENSALRRIVVFTAGILLKYVDVEIETLSSHNYDFGSLYIVQEWRNYILGSQEENLGKFSVRFSPIITRLKLQNMRMMTSHK